MIRVLVAGLALALASVSAAAQDIEPSPARIGALAADAYLTRPEFMMYSVDEVNAVHYADVASAYGALRLAEATGNDALFERVAARHRKLLVFTTITMAMILWAIPWARPLVPGMP